MRPLEMKVVIDSEFCGFDSGWPTRYIGLLQQLSKRYNIKIFAPGQTITLKKILTKCKVCESTTLPARLCKKSRLQLLTNLIVPSRYSPISPAPPYCTSLHSLVRSETSHYDVSVYFGHYAYIYYGLEDHTKTIFCDFCDSGLRFKKNELRKKNTLYAKLSILYDILYAIRVKKKYFGDHIKILAITDYDCQCIKSVLKKNNIYCIPNGIKSVAHKIGNDLIQKKFSSQYIVFVGSLDYKPNEDCLLFVMKEVWPQITALFPELLFKIVGRSPTKKIKSEADKVQHVDIIGPVEKVEPYYLSAKFVLAPIFSGSGMKNKFLEALSQGTPVVTTREGTIGIEFEDGIHGRSVDSRDEIIAAVQDMLNLPFKRYSETVTNCIELAGQYHWDRIGEQFEQVILENISNQGS